MVVLSIRLVVFVYVSDSSDWYQCPITTRYLALKRRLETIGFISLYPQPWHLSYHLNYQSVYQSRKSARTGFSALDLIWRFRIQPSPLLVMHTLFQVKIASQPEAQQLQRTEFVITRFDYCIMHSGNGITGTLCFSSQPEPGKETLYVNIAAQIYSSTYVLSIQRRSVTLSIERSHRTCLWHFSTYYGSECYTC